MNKKFAVMIMVLLFTTASFGQAELEKYVGQYQVTGSPLVITVTASDGKLAIQATGQGKAGIELVSSENFAVTGTPIKLTFQKDQGGTVTGMIIHQAPGLDVSATKINSSSEAPSDKSPHKSAFVTANGIRMNYLDWGGTGDVIIMLAGLGNDAHVFDDIAPSFTDKFHVIGLTRRGFGDTDRPAKGYETTTRVEDIRAFMDAQKIGRAHLVGHSLAGDEMTLFAAMYPQRVMKMVYLDAAYDRRKIFSCANDQPGGLPAAYLRIVGEALNCPGWEKIVAPDMPAPELVNVQVSTMKSAMQFVPDYKKITAPSLAIYADSSLPQNAGKLDEETQKKMDAWWKEKQVPIMRASIEQFRKDMKNGQVVEIKGATHYVFVGTFKDQVIKLMRDFLAK
ncbi:MAG TPA: alpha/beta fold hydrolase [Pyrinomonadaceae bacterium]